MKKNVLIVLLFIITIFSAGQAFFQYSYANKALDEAEKNLVWAMEVQKECDKQAVLIKEELANCKGKK